MHVLSSLKVQVAPDGVPCFHPAQRNVQCFRDSMRVAVKIIKNLDRYREAAMSEVEVLEQMNKLDSSSR